MKVIPFFDFPSFTQEITLDNVPLRFTFNWNSRGEFWSLSIADRDKNPIVSGIKLVVQYEVLTRFKPVMPIQGELYVIDGQGAFTRIAQHDFTNGRLSLIYVPEDEVVTV